MRRWDMQSGQSVNLQIKSEVERSIETFRFERNLFLGGKINQQNVPVRSQEKGEKLEKIPFAFPRENDCFETTSDLLANASWPAGEKWEKRACQII